MFHFEDRYMDIVQAVLRSPTRQTRNGAVRSKFLDHGLILTDLETHFPLLHGRRVYPEGVFGEMRAMFDCADSVADFEAEGCNYWKLWADEHGHLELDYGNAWRNFNGVDQLANVIQSLKEDPYGRRHLLSAWRPDRLDKLSLPCCHWAYQWYVNDDGKLDMNWIQRSTDVMIGLPSNIMMAAYWNIVMASVVGREVGCVRMSLGDTHIYESHVEGAKSYLKTFDQVANRKGIPYSLATQVTSFDNLPRKLIELGTYEPFKTIKFKLEK